MCGLSDMHLGPQKGMITPSREDHPRTGPNFYYAQEDYVAEAAKRKEGLKWSVSRPPCIIGSYPYYYHFYACNNNNSMTFFFMKRLHNEHCYELWSEHGGVCSNDEGIGSASDISLWTWGLPLLEGIRWQQVGSSVVVVVFVDNHYLSLRALCVLRLLTKFILWMLRDDHGQCNKQAFNIANGDYYRHV